MLAAAALAIAGVAAQKPDGGLNPQFVIGVSLGDAALVVALITVFMWRNGESVSQAFVSGRPVGRETLIGLALAPLVLIGVSLVVVAVRTLLPSLHNVPSNPMGALMRDPLVVVTFAFVVVVAGGLREELQRGFQLHRLTGYVCGPLPALLLTSVAFGAGHTVQGYDVAVATGILGAFWATLYLTRGSVVAAAVSHGVFNLSQVMIAWAVGDPTIGPTTPPVP